MPWSDRFLQRLDLPSAGSVLLFESIRELDNSNAGTFFFSTADVDPRYAVRISKDRTELADACGRLTPGACTYAPGSFTVGLALELAEAVDFRTRIRKGMPVQVRRGWRGLATDAYEPIAVGVIRDLTFSEGVYGVLCDELPAWLGSRGFPSAGQYATLFGNLEGPTTIAGGAYSAGDATIHLATTNGAELNSEGFYTVRITSNAGNNFWIQGTGKTATTITGCGAAGAFGSTAAAAANGNSAAICVAEHGHPSAIMRQVLTSTGTRTTGPVVAGSGGYADVLPESWGFACPLSWLDENDIARQMALSIPSAGLPDRVLLSEIPQTNPLQFLQTWLASNGLFLCVRQGRLTVRALLNQPDAAAGAHFEIGADDVKELRAYNAWDPAFPVEYSTAYFAPEFNGGSSSAWNDLAAPISLPAENSVTLTALGVYQNSTLILNELAARVGPWYTRIPEFLEIQTAGLRCAQLAPGDVVYFTFALFGPRNSTRVNPTFKRQRALVLGVRPDPFNGVCGLLLNVLPDISWST